MSNRTARSKRSPMVAARRGPSGLMIVGIVVVLLFAAAVGYAVYHTQHQKDVAAAAAVQPGVTSAGVLPVGQASAPNTVDIYLDFQCPICRQYEQLVGPTIDSMVASGKIKVVYHPIAILDQSSSTQYSSRASAASGCAAAANVFPQFAKLLYANQPPEGGSGLPNDQLVSLGKQAGAPDNFGACVNANTYAAWTAGLTDEASKAGINSTPTIKVNGKQIGLAPAALQAAVK